MATASEWQRTVRELERQTRRWAADLKTAEAHGSKALIDLCKRRLRDTQEAATEARACLKDAQKREAKEAKKGK